MSDSISSLQSRINDASKKIDDYKQDETKLRSDLKKAEDALREADKKEDEAKDAYTKATHAKQEAQGDFTIITGALRTLSGKIHAEEINRNKYSSDLQRLQSQTDEKKK